MPKIDIEGKEYSIPVAVHELIQTMIIDLDHYEAANKDLLEALHQEGHRIVFYGHGWSIQHPVECRPDMTECEIHKAAQEQIIDPPEKLGEYRIWLEDGVLKYE